jgi:hypothetical protein
MKLYETSGLYYKHMPIINYASSIFNKLGASLIDDAVVIINDRHVFIVQTTGLHRWRSRAICSSDELPVRSRFDLA